MPQSVFQGVARAADGTRLAVQARGEGPALLLLAGQANNHHWWDLVRADFVAERTTITFDYRGTGAREFRDMPCSTRQFAQDAVAVLDYFGVASADVYGTSMGGRVATWVAVDAPRRLRRLILGCTTPGDSHSVERSRDVRLSLVATGQSADVLADLMYTPRVPAQPSRPLQHLG